VTSTPKPRVLQPAASGESGFDQSCFPRYHPGHFPRGTVRKGPPEGEGIPPRSRPSSGPSRGPSDGVLSELLKRLVDAGAKNLSAEPMRQLLAEMKIPKDALLHLLSQHLLIQLEETKQNVYRLVARELKVLIERTNVADEIASALTRLSVDVTMQVKFSARDGDAPGVRVKVTSKEDEAPSSARSTHPASVHPSGAHAPGTQHDPSAGGRGHEPSSASRSGDPSVAGRGSAAVHPAGVHSPQPSSAGAHSTSAHPTRHEGEDR